MGCVRQKGVNIYTYSRCICIALQLTCVVSDPVSINTNNTQEVLNTNAPAKEDLQYDQVPRELNISDGSTTTAEDLQDTEVPQVEVEVPTVQDETTSTEEPHSTEAEEQKYASALTSKLMGSIAVAYILICVLLAIKKGPLIVF